MTRRKCEGKIPALNVAAIAAGASYGERIGAEDLRVNGGLNAHKNGF